MPGIKDKVAIIGMGCSKFGERWDSSHVDLAVEAAQEAYSDAGVEPKDIQSVWFGTLFSGFAGPTLSHALKTQYIPVTRIENFCATGIDVLRNACFSVVAGAYELVLAIGVEKLKDGGYTGLPISSLDPDDTPKAFPQTAPPAMFAVYATRYFHDYGLSYEQGKHVLAKIAVKNHKHGTMSPKAHFQREITIEQAMNAPMIAWPLGLFDCCGVSDGAAAAIVTTPEIAKKRGKDYITIKGFGISCGPKEHILRQGYDWVHWEESVRAAKQAYDEAGVKDPRKEISIAQVHDCFTSTELITMEDLGLSKRGEGWKDEEADFFTLEKGGLPVNTDGGLKCFGHPIGATGLRMTYENYKQLIGKAEKRQVKDMKLGLAHNLGGAAGANVIGVAIVGRP
ncbi:MAG: acetyl-CoA acetyltransferase [Chloroflexota bacterium]